MSIHRRAAKRDDNEAEIVAALEGIGASVVRLSMPIPPSANRYWRKFRNRMVVSQEATAYKKLVGLLATQANVTCLDGDVIVRMDVYRAHRRGDLDNFAKCCLDSLQGVGFRNDSQIVELHMRRFDDKRNPRVEVWIEALVKTGNK
jgi:Holliday junction resolvase RusA-like endonuclease